MGTMTIEVDSFFALTEDIIEVVEETNSQCSSSFLVTITPANSSIIGPTLTSVWFEWTEVLLNSGNLLVTNVSEDGVPRTGVATNGEAVTGVNVYRFLLDGFRVRSEEYYSTSHKVIIGVKTSSGASLYRQSFRISRKSSPFACAIIE